MALTKDQRIKILQAGIDENGGRKANKKRRNEVDDIILNKLNKEFAWIIVEVDNANSLKTYIYNRVREDSALRTRSYGFRYMNLDGTEGGRVGAGNIPSYEPPYRVKIIRNENKTDADIQKRIANKNRKKLEKRAAAGLINILK